MSVKSGIYRHYKGGLYRVHHEVRHSETMEPMMLYEALYDIPEGYKFFVRPVAMFSETVVVNNETVPRFAWVGENMTTETQSGTTDYNNLLTLFSLLQTTKEVPLVGYLSAGLKLSEVPTLAEHQYTCAINAIFIGKVIKEQGGVLDVNKVVQILMVHDLGEFFGGDIAAPLNRRFPELRKAKDEIGTKAVELLSSYLPDSLAKEWHQLHHEYESGNSDEKWVAKIIDQLDHQLFLEHMRYEQILPHPNSFRDTFVSNHIVALAEHISDHVTRTVMENVLKEFKDSFYKRGFIGLNELMK